MKKESKRASKKRASRRNSGGADIAGFILNLFKEQPGKRFSLKQISSSAGCNSKEGRRVVVEILKNYMAQGVIESRDAKFVLSASMRKAYQGVVEMTSSGSIFIRCEDMESDVHVGGYLSLNALNGDLVEFVINRPAGAKRSADGEIIRVIERSSQKYIGVAEVTDRQIFIKSSSKNLPLDVYLSKRSNPEVEDGMKVSFRIKDWEEGRRSPSAEIVEILGRAGDNDTEMHAILAEYDLPYRFEERVEAAAQAIDGRISEADYASRRDMRDVVTFTVDPADAKDFDDALSVRKIKDGVWEIGVHIADVSHYVTPGSTIDVEAFERGTSVYLVDRTIPMLPERLSNELCSLRPNEESLCFSVVLTINEGLEILDRWFGRTVIYSDRRFTYADAQAVIDTGKGDYAEEVTTLHRLAQGLRQQRFKGGAIAFERDEVRFTLDDKGYPTGVYVKEHGTSNEMIEEFMLLANRSVAEWCSYRLSSSGRKLQRTMVYRVHDEPDSEKLDAFREFILRFGHYFKAAKGRAVAKEINKLLAEVKGKSEENVVSLLAIRSMAKAIYTTDNIGHYGLAFPHYTHFTSPIRRYPDLLVHRLLASYLDGEKSANKENYEAMCVRSSEREIIAANAERASIKYKMVEYMRDKADEIFEGQIVGVKEWGVFVELDSTSIEGLIPVRELGDEFFIFDAENYQMVGRSSREKFTLGDRLRVKVKRADLTKRLLDFSLVERC